MTTWVYILALHPISAFHLGFLQLQPYVHIPFVLHQKVQVIFTFLQTNLHDTHLIRFPNTYSYYSLNGVLSFLRVVEQLGIRIAKTLGITFFSSTCAYSGFVFKLGFVGNFIFSSFYLWSTPFVSIRMELDP
jgi:hypothetical protein